MAEGIAAAAHYAGCTIRRYRPGDEEGILALFQQVFGRERSLAHWRWKFEENPAGQQIMLAVTETGEIVGHYAGIPVRVTVDGKPFIFSQPVDTMISPSHRRGLKKPGLFPNLTLKFAEEYGGRDRAAVTFGFPTDEHSRLGQRLMGYVALPPVVKLVKRIGSGPHRTPWQQMVDLLHRVRVQVREVDRFDAPVDRLWARCERELRVATVRDARYLNWRYADCPDVHYRLLQAQEALTGRVCGLAVLRLGWMGQPAALLVDWLVPWRDWVTADRLLKRSCQEVELAAMKELQGWMPSASPWHQYLLEWGFQAVDGNLPFVARTYTPEVSLEYVSPRWYYTMGDSDIY